MGSKLGGGGGDDEGIVDINITPFVDIVLVVLIIFMVTSSYIVKQSIKVELPKAATGETASDTSLALMIDPSLNLTIDGEPATRESLRARLRAERTAAQAEGKDVICLIGADKVVPHGEVVGLIDLVRQEGVTKFAINIDPGALPAEAAGALPPSAATPTAPASASP
jgi:biopolymer transport protein TolR